MSETPVTSASTYGIVVAWASGLALGLLMGLGLSAVIQDLWWGLGLGLASGLVLALSMLRWARGVNSGQPSRTERRINDTDYGPMGPGVYGAGHAGRDGGTGR
ncbi:hypothetical protein FHX49_001089 [Microbacterium endophyticum]|uniref:DUF2530 domain-containing protein n=1 Tax=Microbacterium endophyticum TaxID=1526412 RepID=A0A7W4V2A0_9MICO|nr:hypothetical protein [Microbacterium endophyticum]MBB2975523.1 hypothetical protein [Microbacterium endophyticum]NIK35458.1 hypothetical protein [Microbacterium endophyticum]